MSLLKQKMLETVRDYEVKLVNRYGNDKIEPKFFKVILNDLYRLAEIHEIKLSPKPKEANFDACFNAIEEIKKATK